jgi:acyl-CoA thioester hydrolase
MPPATVHRSTFPVRYHESDQMGVVHHAVYVHWFEVGRTAAMKERGLDYAELERRGVLLAVIDVGLRYLAPARFGEEVVVETRITRVERVRVRLEYRVLSAGGESETLLCTGHSLLASVDPELRPIRMPADVRELFLEMLATED